MRRFRTCAPKPKTTLQTLLALPHGRSAAALRRHILNELYCNQAKFPEAATRNDFYLALAYAVRDRLLHRWIRTARTYFEKASRTVVYFSAEYLLGPQLGHNLINLGIWEEAQRAVTSLGLCLEDLLEQEEEPGLGNGGLGRLAACFLDSLATLEIPAMGYGIRYEFGIFDQTIRDGWQIEVTDKWLRLGNPWEVAHPEIEYAVPLGGRTEPFHDTRGRYAVRWIPERVIRGSAYDMAVLGYAVNTANLLRLWKAEATESLDLGAFNAGEYYRAVEQKVSSENISRVLYPNDQPAVGKELRLQQEYFFVSCSLQDMIRIYRQRKSHFFHFHKKYAAQLNDTHPSLAIAELMRLLVDVYGMDWDPAWEITTQTFGYTNHTLLPEALEKWPLPLFRRLLPRHLEIIYEINRRFLDVVRLRWPNEPERLARMSIIEEGPEQHVRMAHLATVGSHAINGVSELHSQLLRSTVLRDFAALWPERFRNVTNGVTPRRFIALANPRLRALLDNTLGTGWIRDLEQLAGLEPRVEQGAFRQAWRRVKEENKRTLADFIRRVTGQTVDPNSLFDVHVKRIHEYKRQHLKVLHIITEYNRLRRGRPPPVPRTFLFAGKAAPGYYLAKLIIKLIHSVADTIGADRKAREVLRVVFLPDFNVKNGQRIYPAADLSEQISCAGFEASGTGNMKFALNGALTIGTLDGANIEIRDAVGPENFFLFGLTAKEVVQQKAEGYRPRTVYEEDPELHEALDLIASGFFCGGDRELFGPLLRALLDEDTFMVLADYRSYLDCQDEVNRAWLNQDLWTRRSILNVARSGRFSSDRAIREYNERIWRVKPVPVRL